MNRFLIWSSLGIYKHPPTESKQSALYQTRCTVLPIVTETELQLVYFTDGLTRERKTRKLLFLT